MHVLKRKSVHVALVIVIGLIVYSNTLHAPFYWDDSGFTESPLVKSFDYFRNPGLAKDFSSYGGFLSRYIGYLTFAINYRLHGLDVTGYHLVNIAIHLLSALLVYRLVSLTLRSPYFTEGRDHAKTDARAGFIALLSALLFVAHPLQTQAVTYIVQRFASLATMFYLLTVTNYLKGRLMLSGSPKRLGAALGWFAGALVSALLALKTKEISYTLPIVIVIFEFLFFTRELRKRLIGLALAAVPVLLLVGSRVSGGSLADLLKHLDEATRLQTDMSRWDYLATQFCVILTYLRLLIFPVGQRLDYDYPVYTSFLNLEVLISGALLCALLGAAFYFLKRSRGRDDDNEVLYRVMALGIFWFFVTIAIESSVIPIVDVIFEHRMYLPSVGLFMALAAAVSIFGGEDERVAGWPPLRVMAGCLAVVLIFCGATFARNQLWSNDASFWDDNAWKSPTKARVFVNLARARERKGDAEGAKEAYQTATRLDPRQTDILLDMGLMAIQKGKLDDALAQFKAALAIDANLVEAHNNIGKVYGMQMRLDDALKEFLLVVKLKPTLAEPHNNIGFVYAQRARYDEALKEYEKCLALDPGYERAHINRGMALLAMGRKSEAVKDFQQALKINPSSPEASQQLQLAGVAVNK